MYKALELYPLKGGTKYEQMVVTMFTRARFHAVDYFLLTQGKTQKELDAYTGRDGLNGNTSIDGYLKAGEFLGWDLSRDINYLYANVIYSPEEIIRRICRVYEWKALTAKRYAQMAASMGSGITADMFISAVNYGPDRSARVYARIMMGIMRMEQVNGYSDALSIEV